MRLASWNAEMKKVETERNRQDVSEIELRIACK